MSLTDDIGWYDLHKEEINEVLKPFIVFDKIEIEDNSQVYVSSAKEKYLNKELNEEENKNGN